MQQYSNMTAIEAYDEVMLRIGRYKNAINIDYDTILSYLNWGVIESLSETLPYKEWAYVGSMAVAHRTAMPNDYVGKIRVLVSDTGLPPYREARYVAPKEYNQLVNWRHAQTWNQGFSQSPVYTVWADRVVTLTTPSPLCIYLYPNTEDVVGAAPTNLFYPTTNVSGIFEYYQAPPLMTQDNDIVPIPYEYESLVILKAVDRALATLGERKIEQIYKEIADETERIIERYQEKRRTEKRELDSFQEPVIPEVTPPPEKGEAEQDLLSANSRLYR